MSDKLFNEVPVVGEKYNYGDWKLYAIHDEKNIQGFFGDFRWLSNFFHCEDGVYFEGLRYPNAECAYQAAKVLPEHRTPFTFCSAVQSKKLWKNYAKVDFTAENWDKRKFYVMSVILFDKFYRNKDLRQKLIDTDNKYLCELNHWGDTFFGIDIKKGGHNKLGIILMKIRDYWRVF